MTILRPETAVVSELLCDHADLPPVQRREIDRQIVRALRLAAPDPDFADSVRSGYVDLDEFDPQLYRPDRGPRNA